MSVGFLFEMGGKSLVISGVACLAFWLLRSRSSADRAAMLRLTMALLLALPLISAALPALQVERPDYGALVKAPSSQVPAATDTRQVALPGFEIPVVQDAPVSAERLALLGYAAGLLLLLVRLLAGLWTLRRWTAAAAPVTSAAWTAAFARASARSRYAPHARLLVSNAVSSPLSWGWRRPVILIDAGSLARVEDADAILAHEIAHLARRDWPALMLSRVAVALFWFNPLVWLLERASIAQAEEAADLHALGWVEPVSYAQSLVACFRHAARRNGRTPAFANSIASKHGLARRVRAILDGGRRDTPSGSVWTLAAMVACVAVTAPVAALQLVSHADLPTVIESVRFGSARQAPPSLARLMRPEPPKVMEVERFAAGPVPPVLPSDADFMPLPPAPPVPVAAPVAVPAMPPAAAARPARPAPLAQVVAAAPVVSVDELISMKIHGLDADFIERMVAVSPRARGLTPNQLISMRIHGMTQARVRTLIKAGERDLDIDQLVGKRMKGVRASAIASARAAATASAKASASAGVAARAVAEAMAEVDRGLSEIDD